MSDKKELNYADPSSFPKRLENSFEVDVFLGIFNSLLSTGKYNTSTDISSVNLCHHAEVLTGEAIAKIRETR